MNQKYQIYVYFNNDKHNLYWKTDIIYGESELLRIFSNIIRTYPINIIQVVPIKE